MNQNSGPSLVYQESYWSKNVSTFLRTSLQKICRYFPPRFKDTEGNEFSRVTRVAKSSDILCFHRKLLPVRKKND